MALVYGSVFRRQEQQRPWWLKALLWFLAAAAILACLWGLHRASVSVWRGYFSLPPNSRRSIGRFVAFALGFYLLKAACRLTRNTLYLNPPIRDLALTPGTALQILRIAYRSQFTNDLIGICVFALFLYPFFVTEWFAALAVPWWPWIKPLAVICALVAAFLESVCCDVFLLAWNLLAATLGFGGVAPRRYSPNWRILKIVALIFSPLRIAAGVAVGILFITMVVNVFVPPQFRNLFAILQVAETIQRYIDDPQNLIHQFYTWCPPVVAFDFLRTSITGSLSEFQAASFRAIIWIVVSGACIVLFLKSGFHPRNRTPWNDDPGAARPADAVDEEKRGFDPDAMAGPLEELWITHFGRMGRAIVRLIMGSYQAVSLDHHIRRILLLFPLMLAAEWLIVTIVPALILSLFGTEATTRVGEISSALAAMCVFGAASFRSSSWTGNYERAKAAQTTNVTWSNFVEGRLNAEAISRGNTKYKLADIYPVGFSDAVLLPLMYVIPFIMLQGLLALIEGVVLGVPWMNLKWGLLIVLPAAIQFAFFILLTMSVGDRVHYSRSRLRQVVTVLVAGTGVGGCIAGLGVLIHYMAMTLIERNQPWLAWVGTLHIMIVFDVALYMLARWSYVRRRFDADTRIGG